MSHRSLIKPHEEPPTKPLVDTKELKELARKTVLQEVETQMLQIAHEETTLQQLQQSIEDMSAVLVEIRDSKNEYNLLKLEVLQKLKNRLNEE